jgi:hypothetical protein
MKTILQRILIALLLGLIFFPLGMVASRKMQPKEIASVSGVALWRSPVFYFQIEQSTGKNPLLLKGSGLSLAKVGNTYDVRGHDNLPHNVSSPAAKTFVQNYQLSRYGQRKHIVISKKELKAYYANALNQGWKGSEKKFLSYFQKRGLSKSEITALMKQDLTVSKILKGEQRKIHVTELDVRYYYLNHISDFKHGELRRVQLITVASRAKAFQLRKRLLAGESFDALAKKFSLDRSAASGGLISVDKDTTLKGFYSHVRLLAVGVISLPFQTKLGWHLVKPVTPVIKPGVWTYKQMHKAIKQNIFSKRSGAASAKFFQKLDRLYPATYNSSYAPDGAPRVASSKLSLTGGAKASLLVFLSSLFSLLLYAFINRKDLAPKASSDLGSKKAEEKLAATSTPSKAPSAEPDTIIKTTASKAKSVNSGKRTPSKNAKKKPGKKRH